MAVDHGSVVQPSAPEILNDDSFPGPFEGPEKLLEVWFAPSPAMMEARMRAAGKQSSAVREDGTRVRGLRCVPRAQWEEMLDIVKCKVLSVVQGEELDSYLLSESSLFVYPHYIILKTCGTTLNLHGLGRINAIVAEHCGLDSQWRLFYSRKSFFFPELQKGPHREWSHEVEFLESGASGHGYDGNAYYVGPINRDHWVLYLTSPDDSVLEGLDDAAPAASVERPLQLPPPSGFCDQTLEILMTHLRPEGREPFFVPAGVEKTGHELGVDISRQLGIDALFSPDETSLDSFGFEPCGYSANAVIGTGLPESNGGYFTIHVTPEDGWSFASFECNVPLPAMSPSAWASRQGSPDKAAPLAISNGTPNGANGHGANGAANANGNGQVAKGYAAQANGTGAERPDLRSLISRVVDIFQPNRFSVTLFVSTENDTSSADAIPTDILGRSFTRRDKIGYEFEGYDLVFACFERKGWKEPKKPSSVAGSLAGSVTSIKALES